MTPSSELLTTLADLLDEGWLKAIVSASLPLAKAARAQELSRGGHTRGKIVLSIS